MSSQNPYDPSNAVIPPTQYAQPSEYVPVNPYGQQQQQAEYAPANPYVQQQAGYPPVNPYGQPPMYAYPPQFMPMQLEKGRGQALAGLILGIVGMIAWIFPLVGFPVAIVGLIMSILGRRSASRKGMAIAGIILSSIAIVLTICSAGFGAYVAMHRYY